MTKNKRYSPVDLNVNFVELEKKLLDQWYNDGIVDKYLAKNSASPKTFSFQDGPITANNPMGVHHAWGRTYKDLWQRYKNMQGFKQRFQNGFDSQGLWVEVEVEKELGFTTKKDIEKYGIDKFVQKCKERVMKYSKIQTDQSKRLGYFMDWENSYYTMSDENNYMIWHFLKVCNDNGWLYKGNDSVPWCPRCETAISQHEMLTEDYKEVVHDSIYFELPLVGENREFFLVWTTTPWTIPANIALAVDAKLDYSLVEGKTKDKFWLASEAVERVFLDNYKILTTVKGKFLVGKKYRAPFDTLPAVTKVMTENGDKFHIVVATDSRIMPISQLEGTGIVHTAVSAGTEDFKLGKQLGLPMIPVIKDDASYLDGFGFLSGKNAKKHPEIILDYLTSEDKKEGVDWVFKIEKIKHRYPGCWRCKTELVWKVTDEWYIAMDKPSSIEGGKTLRERMIDVTKLITWIPDFGLKRELDWLTNMHDWLISKKNRYWGLSLPIWECKSCKHFEVIGGKDELEKKACKGWDKFTGKSPHKPQIDEIKIICSKCGEVMSRIEPVGNPWLDAGIVMYSTIAQDNKEKPLYHHDKKMWRKWFPVDFITESFPGQFKNWFYSMIAMSTVLENERPFKSVLGFATLLDESGRAMHKSWGNSIEFEEGADKMGADVIRWIYARQNPMENLLFGYKYADEVRRQFILKIWNVYNYFVTYANKENWSPATTSTESTNVLDVWITARLNKVIEEVTNQLDAYDAFHATSVIEKFVDDLSNWYVRRSRDRIWADDSDSDKTAFFQTLYDTLIHICLLMAPFTPFLTDSMYKNLTGNESVHLADWPKSNKLAENDKDLILHMDIIRSVVEAAHSSRKENDLPVRRPLIKLEVFSPALKPDEQLLTLAKDELNVKNIVWSKSEKLEIQLDTTLTQDLENEMKARELLRNIQNERKKLGIGLEQLVRVTSPWIPEDEKAILQLKNKALVASLSHGEFRVRLES
ncbi:isoleucine--tRNA ligase [Candidatus Woesebacteria bacterium]|nr:MAG: isoleucine--tRNA ligase [Candidatus Woesebacteria bacterium]